MATSIQIKRGATAKVAAYTPLNGELVLDTTKNSLVAGDGSTAGGIPLKTNADDMTGVLPISKGGSAQSDVSFVRAEDTTSVTLTANTFTRLTPAEITDSKNAYNPATGIWTCPADGYYQVIGSVRFGNPATSTCTRMIKIDSGSSPSTSGVVGQTSLISAGAGDTCMQVSTLIQLSQGATLSLYAFHTDSAAMSAIQKSLQIIRVR
ncbi:hypothetical protein ACR3LR_08575 [Pantoea eucalypti]|uniref:hyaluronate lyase N-terminal domain-containing protein n=1 Tax=Pantoea eucalypti TaxID=470933 RepID=UPI003EE68453